MIRIGKKFICSCKFRKVLLLVTAFAICLPLWACSYRYSRLPDGRTLWRIGTAFTVDNLHPYSDDTPVAHLIFSLIYESLFSYNVDTGVCEPSVCESYTVTPNADESWRWDITLRSDACWSNGDAVTTDDVAFSLQSQSDFSFLHAFSDCTLINPVSIDASDSTHMAFIAFADESSVLYALSQIPILPKSVWNSLEYMDYDYRGLAANYKAAYEQLYHIPITSDLLLGSGPYRFVSIIDNVCTLKRNPYYSLASGRTDVIEIYFEEPDCAKLMLKGKLEELF